MSERSMVFEYKGVRFQIDKTNPLDGSNIIRRFTSSATSDPQEFLANMSDEAYHSIQITLLKNVFEIQTIEGNDVTVPVLHNEEVIGSLSKDSFAIFGVVNKSLMFNLSDFFGESALKDIQQMMEPSGAPKQ
jgi:hypothetical protein